MKKNTVDYYFNKIDEARNYYNGLIIKNNNGELDESRFIKPYSSQEEKKLRYNIKKMIDDNIDYLLTDSYLDYLGFGHEPSQYLDDINSSTSNRMNIITWYLYGIVNGIRDLEEDGTHYFRYMDFLDDDTKKSVIFMDELIDRIGGRGNTELHVILMSIFAYCYINGVLDKLESLCYEYIADHERFLDDLHINQIVEGSIMWYERLTTFIEDYLNENRRDIL